jgi:hypothetical protein
MSDAPSGVTLILQGDPLDDTTFFTKCADARASLVIAINVLVACRFSIAGLVNPKSIPAGELRSNGSLIHFCHVRACTIPLSLLFDCDLHDDLNAAFLLPRWHVASCCEDDVRNI